MLLSPKSSGALDILGWGESSMNLDIECECPGLDSKESRPSLRPIGPTARREDLDLIYPQRGFVMPVISVFFGIME